MQGKIFSAINRDFQGEIDNVNDAGLDTGLVQVNPAVTVTSGNLLGIASTLAPVIGGFVLTLSITLAVQQ